MAEGGAATAAGGSAVTAAGRWCAAATWSGGGSERPRRCGRERWSGWLRGGKDAAAPPRREGKPRLSPLFSPNFCCKVWILLSPHRIWKRNNEKDGASQEAHDCRKKER
ncbi:hypothetical protein SESBI_42293 [Sesbania bispinosa]|nr:hypothetical protein SESBI_42293 [Sesbania bispinosa]